MSVLVVAIGKELRRFGRDPFELVLWIGLPAAILILLTATFDDTSAARDTAPVRPELLVVDEDETWTTSLVRGLLAQRAVEDVLEVRFVASEVGRARADAGETTAVLVLPSGFEDALLADRPLTLRLVVNPSQRILPRVVEEMLAVVLDAASHLQKLLGEPLRELAADGGAADLGVSVLKLRRRAVRIRDAFDPPLIAVETVTAGARGRSNLDLGRVIMPGLLWMSLLLIAQGGGAVLWRDRATGTLARVLVAPRGAVVWLVGRLGAGAVLTGGIAAIACCAGWAAYDLAPATLPWFWVWTVAAGALFQILFLVVALLASTESGANLMTTMIAFPLMMIGGSFVPFALMPGWMSAIGRASVNGWTLTRAQGILGGAPGSGELALGCGGLAIMGAVAFALAVRLLGGRFAERS